MPDFDRLATLILEYVEFITQYLAASIILRAYNKKK